MKPHRIRLRRTPWTLSYPENLPPADRDAMGTAQRRSANDPTKGGIIRVRRSLGGRKRLEVELHEAMHACLWDTDEEAIRESAADIARMLWKLGYRIPAP